MSSFRPKRDKHLGQKYTNCVREPSSIISYGESTKLLLPHGVMSALQYTIHGF